MMRLFLILCLTLFYGCAGFTCPQGCRCGGYLQNNEVTVECQNIDIYSVLCPSLHSAKYLKVTHSRGKVIKESMFAEFPSIRTLVLSDNNIERIEPKAFNNLQKLQLLDLARNNITDITQGAFTSITNIVTLILTGNKLKSVYPGIFDTLDSLYDLQLDNNEIQEVQCKTFEELHFLDNLDLSGNKLEYLPSCAFQGLRSLKVLRLSHNKIKSLPKKIFTPLINLKALHMIGNYFEILPTFQGLEKLQVLNLADNDLPIIPSESLANMKSLRLLTLSGNPILGIGVKDLIGLKSLTTLHLNRMSVLSEIEPDTFEGLTNLEMLTMQEHNSALDLPKSLFSKIPKLNYFVNGKELVETEHIPNEKDLEKQFDSVYPDGVAIAPNVKIVDVKRPSHQGSFSEQMKELIDYYHQQNKGVEAKDKQNILVPEEEMNSLNQDAPSQTGYNSYASTFNQLSPKMDDHSNQASDNSKNTNHSDHRINRGLIGAVIATLCSVSLLVTGIIYRGRRRRSKFIGYTPVSREDMDTMDLLSKTTKAVTSYGTA